MAREPLNAKTLGAIVAAVALVGLLFLSGVAIVGVVLAYEFPGHVLWAGQVTNTKYAEKPRLPDDMHDIAQAAADHFQKQEFEEAAACYQTIIDRYPDSLYAWSNLGVVRYQQRDYDAARTALEKAVALSPQDAFSHANLGITYYQLGRYDDAIKALEEAVRLDPNDAKSWNYLGCCYSQKGDRQKAEEDYKKAIELDEKFGDAYFNLALVYATAKPPDLGQAKACYQQALDLGVARDPRLEKLIAPDSGTN